MPRNPPLHERIRKFIDEVAPEALERTELQNLLTESMARDTEFDAMTYQLRETDAMLRDITERYDTAFQNGPVACVIVNRSGELLDYNRAFGEFVGVSPTLSPPPPFLRFIDAEYVGVVTKSLTRRFHGTASHELAIKVLTMRFGLMTQTRATLTVTPASAVDGRALLTLSPDNNYNDRSDQVPEQADRAVKSQFLANMSHEIRTPLTVIMGYLELLENDVPESRETISVIMDSADQLLGIVNGVLDMSRIESGTLELKRTTTSVHELADVMRNMFELQFESAGCLLNVIAEDSSSIVVDTLRVRQVFSNLISNALKFSPSGSRVDVRMGYRAGTFVGSVQDTGLGISATDCERIFEPFHQLPNQTATSSTGVGLGLAICQQLMTAMGGFVRVRSQLGEGATFHLQLPCETVEAPTVQEKVVVRTPRVTDDQRVLIVDDDPLIRMLAETILSSNGYVVHSAVDGVEAIDTLQDSQFDLLLLDMRMPRMNGFEVATWVRARPEFREVAILACSASALEHEVTRCLEAGCDAHLAKPFRLASLLSAIEALLATDKP